MARPQLSVTPPPDDDGANKSGYQWTTADKGKATKPNWLLPRRIIGNGLAIVEGDPSTGKSTFLAHLAAAITTGKPWLGRSKQVPRHILWLSGEEDPLSMIRPRLVAAGCDLSCVHWPEPDDTGVVRPLFLPGCVQALYEAVDLYNLALIIIEPLVSFVPPDLSLNQEGPARSVCDPLNRLGIQTGCCVLFTRGLRKDRTGPRLSHGSGHGTIANTARSVLVIDRPDQEQERRIMRTIKCGLTGPTPPLEYSLDLSDGVPRMVGIAELSAALDDGAGEAVDVGEKDVRADARVLLKEMCATEYVPSTDMVAAGKASGIGERTLRKVKAELGVHSKWVRQPAPGYHAWGPPLKGWNAPTASPPVQPTKRAGLEKKPRKSRKKEEE